MSLIGRFIDQLLPVGSISVIEPNGHEGTYGPGGGQHVTVRLHDRRVGLEIFRNPRLKFGELYMDGRVTIEDGTILDL
jgi:cyclopropane-fatty-acyl-phospholipid synthase